MKTNTNKTKQTKFRWFATFFGMISIFILLLVGVFAGLNQSQKYSSNLDSGSKIVLKIDDSKNENLASTDPIKKEEAFNKTYNFLTASTLLHGVDAKYGNDVIVINSDSTKEDSSKNTLISELTTKPYITITDRYGNPLFYKNNFVKPGSSSEATLEKLVNGDPADFSPSFENNPASWNTGANAGRVSLTFTEKGNRSWQELLNFYPFMYYGEKVYIWTNLKEFVNIAKTKFPHEWDQAGHNPVNFAYIGNSSRPTEYTPPKQNPDDKPKTIKKDPVLKKNEINASKYLLTAYSPYAINSSKAGSRQIFIINNTQAYNDKQLSAKINFAYSPFKLDLVGSYYVFGAKHNYSIVALVFSVIFSLLGAYLIVNYRLLGGLVFSLLALNTIASIAIMFAFGAYISPLLVISLLLGTLMAFSFLNNTLQKFKAEMLQNSTPVKAAAKAQKSTFLSSLDSVVAVVVLAIFGIYLGTQSVTTMSGVFFLTTILSAILIIFAGHGLIYCLTRQEAFNKSPWLLSSTKSLINKTGSKLQFNKTSVWGYLIFLVIIVAFIILIFLPGGSPQKAIPISNELQNHYSVFISGKSSVGFSSVQADDVVKTLQLSDDWKVTKQLNSLDNQSYIVNIFSTKPINFATVQNSLSNKLALDSSAVNLTNYHWTNSGFLTQFGWSWLPIFIAMLLISFYVLIRNGLISAFVLWLKEIFVLIMLTMFIVIFKANINDLLIVSYFIATIAVICSHITASNTIFNLTHRDTRLKNYIFSREEITTVFNNLIISRFKTLFVMLIVTIIALIPTFLLFDDQSLLLSESIVAIAISIWLFEFIFIPIIWKSLINKKFANKQKRIKNFYWNTSKIEEQEFLSINDFNK